MKNPFLFLTFLLLSVSAFAQKVPDSVTVYINNRVEVLIEIDDYVNLKQNKQVESIITSFKNLLPSITNELKIDKSEIVTYLNDSVLTIEEGDSKRIYLKNEGSLSNTGVRDKAILIYNKLKIVISTNDLSQLSEISLINCLETAFDSLPEKSRVSQSFYFQCIDGKVSEIVEKLKKNTTGDILQLTVGSGISLLKNSSFIDFTFSMDVILFNKGLTSHHAYVSTNLMYDFLTDRKMKINTFLNIGYVSHYFNTEKEESSLGFELGYLISRKGDLFDENTFRFGISKSIGKHIYFTPQLYMEDQFKRFYPGVRLDIRL